jgi:hypothetical protein
LTPRNRLNRRSAVVALVAAAALFVAVATVVDAIRTHSWEPVLQVGWLPAVLVASYGSGRSGSCRQRVRVRTRSSPGE